jgi:NACalpha-BTF3-like transcription factor
VTFAQTSRGGAQVIDTGTETAKESTAKMKDFEFTSQKINEAREAYLAGDLTKANDILTAAEIKQYGVQANADQFFASSTPQVTPADPTVAVAASGLTQQQEDGIQRVMADNEMTREDAIKALKEAGKLK